jgi:hypothetical protein
MWSCTIGVVTKLALVRAGDIKADAQFTLLSVDAFLALVPRR